jgi:hypothetical protein
VSEPRFSNRVKLKCETALVINGKSVISIDFYLVTNLTKICKGDNLYKLSAYFARDIIC